VTELCRSCGAPVDWTRTTAGTAMPVDAEPVEAGTIQLVHSAVGRPPAARFVAADERAELERQDERRGERLRLFVSHFSTCPHSDKWRRR
jgi:hypothetical protein